MKAATFLLAALLLGAVFLAAAPAAEAAQLCVYNGRTPPCHDHLVCVWNRLTMEWDCYGYVGPCCPESRVLP